MPAQSDDQIRVTSVNCLAAVAHRIYFYFSEHTYFLPILADHYYM